MTALSSTISTRAPLTSIGAVRCPCGFPALAKVTVNQKVDPFPSTLSTPMSPSMRCTRRDVMARPRPVPVTPGGGVNLAELFENKLQFAGGNADAGVGHADAQLGRALLRSPVTSTSTWPDIGEVHRIAEQVGHDLTEAADVADEHLLGTSARPADDQFQVLFLGAGRNQRRHVLDRLGEVEGAGLIDLREVRCLWSAARCGTSR